MVHSSASFIGKIPLHFVVIHRLFPFIEWLSPEWAARLAQHYFFRPLRFRIPEEELAWRNRAKIKTIFIRGKKTAVLYWPSEDPNAEKVLLMHGWGSRSTHFHVFIERLLEKGYGVVAIDAPAHGLSEGKQTELTEFAEAIASVSGSFGCSRWITHSMGGAASLYALLQGATTKHLTMMATPAIAGDIASVFAEKINASEKLVPRLKEKLDHVYHHPLAYYSAYEMAGRLISPPPVLLIYDSHDKEVPVEHGEKLRNRISGATLIRTEKLGHTRIIKSDKTLTHILDDWAIR